MLPIYPIYPNEIWMEFNVSLAIPGPKIYSIPGAGDIVKKLGIENYNTSVLFPDIKYIKKFANYDLGIADSILKSSMVTNLSKVDSPESLKQFTKVSGINIDNFDKYKLPNGRIKIPIDDITFDNKFDMVGLKAFERTIISSIFESQKPYFEIAQLSINYLVKIEDLIARFMPLVGAGINPLFALAIQSRKPKGNDGSHGTPPALGYSKELRNNLNDFKKISTKGGRYDYTNPVRNITGPTVSDTGLYSSQYTTVSIVYSTGEFQPDVKYIYEYIDLEDELEEQIEIDVDDSPDDVLPKNIILGIFDDKGSPINPSDNLIVQKMINNQLIDVDTGFKKAEWLLRTDKWILNKSIKNTYVWDTLEDPLYYWSNGRKIIKSKTSPGKRFKQVKYKDIINFNDSKNESQAFKKDEPVVEYNKTSYESYEKMLDKVVDNKLKRLKNLSSEKRTEIIDNVSKLYKGDNNTVIPEIIDSLNIYSKLKKSYYDDKIDPKDNSGNISGGFPDSLKRVFKPMNFNIGGEEKWIDPEIDYDIKVIRVDSVRKKVDASEDKIISKKTNNHLVTSELYSKGRYGDSWKGGVIKNKKGRAIRKNGKVVRIEDNPNHVGWIKRDMLDEADVETYYIIEGVLSRENKTDIAIRNGGSGFYRLFDAIGAIKVLIEMVIEMFTKIIPPMVSFIDILKNPPEFIVEIIIKKLGEHFSFFSPPALKMINKLPSLQREVEAGTKTVDQFRKIVNKSIISNYVFVENDGRYRFLLDGSGLTEFSLFGKTIQFGIKVKAEDVVPIELIFKVISDKNTKDNNDQIKVDLSEKDKQFGDNKNEIITNSNGVKYIETTTVQYSTGDYIEGVKYKYIYINEEIEKLIIEGDDIVKNNGDLNKTIGKYNLAVSKAKQSGLDTNDAFFKFITDKINGILTLSTQLTQPLIKSILGFATLPLKIVGKIVEFLMDFVKSLIVLPEMPDKVTEFLSFKWIMKFFTPMGILELIGIKFDPTVLNNWFSKLESFGRITTSLNSLNDFKDLNLFFKDLNRTNVNINSKYKITEITSRISRLNQSISSLKSGVKEFGGSSESLSKIDELSSKINSMSKYKSFDEFNQVRNFKFDDILFFKDDLLNTINNYTFDLSEFMSIDFELVLPRVTIQQFTDMLMKPLRLLFPLLCLFEKIINSFIMLVWSIMGISAIIPPPLLRFCQPLNENLSPSDLKDILQVMLSNDTTSEIWVYDVKLENGDVKTFTNYNELQDYISENSNIEFNFNF